MCSLPSRDGESPDYTGPFLPPGLAPSYTGPDPGMPLSVSRAQAAAPRASLDQSQAPQWGRGSASAPLAEKETQPQAPREQMKGWWSQAEPEDCNPIRLEQTV